MSPVQIRAGPPLVPFVLKNKKGFSTMEEKIKKLRKLLEEKDLDTMLLFNGRGPFCDPTFFYFTNLLGFENSVAVLGDTNTVYASCLDVPRAKKGTWVKDVRELKMENVFETLAKDVKTKRVGVNYDFISANLRANIERAGFTLVDLYNELWEMRAIKTSEEIKQLEKSCDLTMKLFNKINTEKTERQIAADLAYEVTKNGAKFAFDPVIAYDANSAAPHTSISNTTGETVLLVNIGVLCNGYNSDITRTFKLKEDIELNSVYKTVQEAHDLAIGAIKPGVRAADIDKIVRNRLKSDNYKLMHLTGHGVGVLMYERPHLIESSEEVLKEGMVFTIEPGIYLEGKFGVRIEDMIVVTNDGCRILSRDTKTF